MKRASFYRLLKANSLIRSSRLKAAWVLASDALGLRHLVVQFDPVNACNLRCTMCYYGNPDYTKRKRKAHYRFSESDIRDLAKIFFPKALALNIGAAAEATVHKNFIDIILLAKQYKVPSVSLTTNGQKLTSAEISAIVSSGLNEMILSVHGVAPETYEHFMGNAKFSKLLDVLNEVNIEKERMGSQLPEIRLNYTANPSNFRELKDLVGRFKAYNIATLQVRPVVDIPDAPYEWEDFSPYRKEYNEILLSLSRDCQKNNIRLLATFTDPTLKKTQAQTQPSSINSRYGASSNQAWASLEEEFRLEKRELPRILSADLF